MAAPSEHSFNQRRRSESRGPVEEMSGASRRRRSARPVARCAHLQWRKNLLLRRLSGFGDRSHRACSLIGVNFAVQLRRCLAVHRIRSAPTLAGDVVAKPPVEQFKFCRHRGMMPRGPTVIKGDAGVGVSAEGFASAGGSRRGAPRVSRYVVIGSWRCAPRRPALPASARDERLRSMVTKPEVTFARSRRIDASYQAQGRHARRLGGAGKFRCRKAPRDRPDRPR